jgi:hypothetical protein
VCLIVISSSKVSGILGSVTQAINSHVSGGRSCRGERNERGQLCYEIGFGNKREMNQAMELRAWLWHKGLCPCDYADDKWTKLVQGDDTPAMLASRPAARRRGSRMRVGWMDDVLRSQGVPVYAFLDSCNPLGHTCRRAAQLVSMQAQWQNRIKFFFEVGLVPACAHLLITRSEDEPLRYWSLRALLQTLRYGHMYDQPLQSVRFPGSLLTLTFGSDFNESLQGVSFPALLQTLTLGEVFDQPLKGVKFPASLLTLNLGREFDQPLLGVNFPAALEILTFGDRFNQPLQGVKFPASLHSLTFGVDFNQPLQGVDFPASLQTLTMPDEFNQAVHNLNILSNELVNLAMSYLRIVEV